MSVSGLTMVVVVVGWSALGPPSPAGYAYIYCTRKGVCFGGGGGVVWCGVGVVVR